MSTFDFAKKTLTLSNGTTVGYFSLPALEENGLGPISTLPYAVRILLESLVRNQQHPAYSEDHVTDFAKWTPDSTDKKEYPYSPARVLLQDFTGVPCVVDLAALRDVMKKVGNDPDRIEPLIPVDLIIDHSVQIDAYGSNDALDVNMKKEFERNAERYEFLKWGQDAFTKLNIVPPGLGICHQINLEYLANGVVMDTNSDGETIAYPDTLVGTDSHTTMINGIGVLGWGVGGIEAEAAMLGQPIPILTPTVTGVRLSGILQPGITATDLALAVTQKLREVGVVGQIVEYFGPGLDHLTLADRATVANMAPEYGATTGFFPIDEETLTYMRQTGRTEQQVELVKAYCQAQGLFRTSDSPEPTYSRIVDIDLSTIEASVAGPKRPHDRINLSSLKTSFEEALTAPVKERGFGLDVSEIDKCVKVDERGELKHGSIVIASITSCTNTSNPDILLTAGLIAQKAVKKGLKVSPLIKTSLAPGSRVVTEYLKKTGLLESLDQLGFNVTAYGCATCIGNSGPIDDAIENAIKDNGIVASAVLSGNRNFEGRIHAQTKANYLCSPPLVVAYALAGTMAIDLTNESLGTDTDGNPVYLKDLWPSKNEVQDLLNTANDPEIYRTLYQKVSTSSPVWNAIDNKKEAVFTWNEASTYIQNPTFVSEIEAEPKAVTNIENANVLGYFGDFITTDHISPAGAIPADGPAGKYLIANGVQPQDFNSFGSRRGNHEVMMRGTFANVRIRNKLVNHEGGYTIYHPTGEEMAIYDAAMKYQKTQTPLVVVAGKLYGAGSSRDWAAKGTYLLGVKTVIAESFERIHRSNLVEMGVLPLEFVDGQTAESLGITGKETFTIEGIADLRAGDMLNVTAVEGEKSITFQVKSRIDSHIEVEYFRHGGILPYVLRDMMNN